MMFQYFFLLFLLGLLTTSLLLFNQLPHLISRADTINPNNLEELYDPKATSAIFDNQTIALQPEPQPPSVPQVLGDNTQAKRIEIDLTTQHLYAYEGDQKKFD